MNNVVKKKKIDKLLNDKEYIKWLEEFTLENPKFYCDSWIFSGKTRENIQDISLLYEAIQNYANENYISPILTNCGNYYSFKHNNIGYHIGIMMGPETIYYCEKTNDNENYINFVDIQKNTKTSEKLMIDNKMKELTQIINDMIDNNISNDIILEVTEKTLQKTLKKEKRTF